MEIRMYFYSEKTYYQWRVFQLIRKEGKLFWKLEDLGKNEEWVKIQYPSAILYPPFKGNMYDQLIDFDQEEFELMLGAPREH